MTTKEIKIMMTRAFFVQTNLYRIKENKHWKIKEIDLWKMNWRDAENEHQRIKETDY